MTDDIPVPAVILDGYQRQYDRTRARADEVNAKPDAQPWEVEQASDSLADARHALDVHAAAYAAVRLPR